MYTLFLIYSDYLIFLDWIESICDELYSKSELNIHDYLRDVRTEYFEIHNREDFSIGKFPIDIIEFIKEDCKIDHLTNQCNKIIAY